MKLKCPYCSRTLLNHRVDRCQYCKRVLPPELRLPKPVKKKLKCPHCGRPLVNRLVDRCLYCKGILPPEMCLSVEEKDKLRAQIEARIKQDKQKRHAQSGLMVMPMPTDCVDYEFNEFSDEQTRALLTALPWTKYFIPQYNELSLYLISVTFLLLGWWNPSLRMSLVECFKTQEPWLIIVIILFLLGLGLPLFTVFTPRIPSRPEKLLMLFFAVLASAGAGIASGVYIIQSENLLVEVGFMKWILLILPAWNILSSVYMLILFRYHVIDESSISDELVKVSQFLLANLILLPTLVICHYVFHFYWAITFSISVAYATMPNSRVNKVSTVTQDVNTEP